MSVNQVTGDLRDRHIALTGASGALGGAVLEELLGRGATCHLPLFEREIPERFTLARHERARATSAIDLVDESSTRAYFESLPPLWASVHLAGGFVMADIADTSLGEFERMWRLNGVTCFLCCREAVRAIRRGGAGGRILNVAARPVVKPAGGMVAYSASKAVVAAITQSLAEELRGEQLLVNAVLPSIIDTEANRKGMPQADHASWPRPEELAQMIGFLVSPRNTLTSGALVPVYGRA